MRRLINSSIDHFFGNELVIPRCIFVSISVLIAYIGQAVTPQFTCRFCIKDPFHLNLNLIFDSNVLLVITVWFPYNIMVNDDCFGVGMLPGN